MHIFYDDSIYSDMLDFFAIIYHYERHDQVSKALDFASKISRSQSQLKKISEQTKVKEDEIKKVVGILYSKKQKDTGRQQPVCST